MASNTLSNRILNQEIPVSDKGHMASTRAIPAWVISLGVHVLIIFILFSIRLTTNRTQTTLITSAIDEMDPSEYSFAATVTDQIGSEGKVNLVGPSQASSTEVSQDRPEEIEKQLDQELLTVNVPIENDILEPTDSDLTKTYEAVGKTDHPGGVEGAMDRLTYELMNSLKERQTLAVWLLDESDSLKERRKVIADRIDNVYKQLGQLDAKTDVALETAVVGFNEDTHFYTEKPVKDVREVIEKIRKPRSPKTPNEHVFGAVYQIAQKWKGYKFKGSRQRANVMIFVVTDERGDDYAKLEQSIQFCKRNGIRVYCIGNSAVFGREKGYVAWTYPDGFTEQLPVDQGPETVAPERVQLPFWNGGNRDLDRMSASFGPYALTRMCAETGGMYFVTAESLFGPRFDPAVMRNYPPDYRPIKDYQSELGNNIAKGALVRAAKQTWNKGFPSPQLRFRADTDNNLRQEITVAQRPMADIDYRLKELEAILSMGEKDRDKLKSPRWQASFDLAIGRLYAWRVRAFGYNMILAEMKSSPAPFKKKGNNMWRLAPSGETKGPPAVRKLAKNANKYLNRVVQKHPGTPWAYLAQRELDQPLGWDWVEGKMNIPNTGPGSNNKTVQLAEDEAKKKKEMQRKQDAARKRPKPLL